VLVPYLRGTGPRASAIRAPRMAEQAAIGQDLVVFRLRAQTCRVSAVAGTDLGRLARGLDRRGAARGSYTRNGPLRWLLDSEHGLGPAARAPAADGDLVSYYFRIPSAGGAGLAANRRMPCAGCCGKRWSPGWHFSDETFNRTAVLLR